MTLRYTIFAAIAIALNISTQELFSFIFNCPHEILASIAAGTGVGFFAKYFLDKRYVFKFQTNNIPKETQTFIFYFITSLVSTAIFWGFELLFDLIFQTKTMRYLGGISGLVLGYLTKYHIDRRYVFKKLSIN